MPKKKEEVPEVPEPEEKIEPPKKTKENIWEVKLVQSLTDPFVNIEAVVNTETEEVIYSKNPYTDAHVLNELKEIKKAIV